jgi:hypothetical protein
MDGTSRTGTVPLTIASAKSDRYTQWTFQINGELGARPHMLLPSHVLVVSHACEGRIRARLDIAADALNHRARSRELRSVLRHHSSSGRATHPPTRGPPVL